MTGYRQVLAVPGMASLFGVSLLARTAITSDVMALTLYVVLGLGLSYAAAGGVVAALTAGVAIGGPLLGRLIDRRGLRTVLLATVVVQAVFWLSVPALSYGTLLGAAFAAGVLMVPAQSVTRQAITAMTTPARRRAAFALEAVQGELSYIVGPAVVIVFATATSPTAVVWAVGAAIVAGGAGMAVLNPPVRTREEVAVGRVPRREWLGAGMVAVLTMGFGTTMLLGGVDLAIVAALREAGQVSWAAVVVAVFGVASVVGGLVYGALTRQLPTWLLLGALGLVTVPAGLAHHWAWLCVAVVGAGLLTAPTLTTVADAVSRLAPAGVRGEATGLQSSAQSAGFAFGAPVVGVAIDLSAPAGGFAAAGLAGIAGALLGYLLLRRGHRRATGRRGRRGGAHRRAAGGVGGRAHRRRWRSRARGGRGRVERVRLGPRERARARVVRTGGRPREQRVHGRRGAGRRDEPRLVGPSARGHAHRNVPGREGAPARPARARRRRGRGVVGARPGGSARPAGVRGVSEEDRRRSVAETVAGRFGTPEEVAAAVAFLASADADGHAWRNPVWRHGDGSFAEW